MAYNESECPCHCDEIDDALKGHAEKEENA